MHLVSEKARHMVQKGHDGCYSANAAATYLTSGHGYGAILNEFKLVPLFQNSPALRKAATPPKKDEFHLDRHVNKVDSPKLQRQRQPSERRAHKRTPAWKPGRHPHRPLQWQLQSCSDSLILSSVGQKIIGDQALPAALSAVQRQFEDGLFGAAPQHQVWVQDPSQHLHPINLPATTAQPMKRCGPLHPWDLH